MRERRRGRVVSRSCSGQSRRKHHIGPRSVKSSGGRVEETRLGEIRERPGSVDFMRGTVMRTET